MYLYLLCKVYASGLGLSEQYIQVEKALPQFQEIMASEELLSRRQVYQTSQTKGNKMLTVEQRYQVWTDTVMERYQTATDCPFFNEYEEYQQAQIVNPTVPLAVCEVAVSGAGIADNLSSPSKTKAFRYHASSWSYGIIKGEKVIQGWNVNDFFITRLNTDNKALHPILNLLSNGRLGLVCLDIDKLHLVKSVFGGCVDTWEDVRNRVLSVYLQDGALIIPSVSGKAKAFFLVNGVLTPDDVRAWINQNIEPRIVACLDLGDSALSKCFVDRDIAENINLWLECNPKIYHFDGSSVSYMHDLLYSQAFSEEVYTTGKNEWTDYTGELPKLKVSKTAEKIIRFLLGNPYLAIHKIGLSQDWLAKRYGVSQQSISIAIHHLIKKEWLVILSKHYQGVCSARYQVAGELLELARDKYFDRCHKVWHRPEDRLKELPTAIEDGNWTEVIMANTKWFKEPDYFMDWISSVPGFNQDRENKAISIWNSHAITNGYKGI